MTNKGTQRGFGKREGQPFINREHRFDVTNTIAAYSITPDDRLVALVSTSVLQPILTLPPAALFRKGATLQIWDDANILTPYGVFAINLKVQTNPYANDTIQRGTVPIVITATGGWVELTSDGVSNWTILNQSDDIQVFTANGTWTKRPGYQWADIWLVGGGGGGGSGTSGASGASSGGAGGAPGGICEALVPIGDLAATEAVVVGSVKAAGGAGKNAAVGAVGTAGTTTTFGSSTRFQGIGGTGGVAGGTADTANTAAVTGQPWGGHAGGKGTIATTGQAGGGSTVVEYRGLLTFSPGAGGGGGGGSNLPTTGGTGGVGWTPERTPPAGSVGASPSLQGTDAPDRANGRLTGAGGGGSGGSNNVGTGGRGGNGGFPGGGGGGSGGAVSTSGITGAGGTGGLGLAIIVSRP